MSIAFYNVHCLFLTFLEFYILSTFQTASSFLWLYISMFSFFTLNAHSFFCFISIFCLFTIVAFPSSPIVNCKSIVAFSSSLSCVFFPILSPLVLLLYLWLLAFGFCPLELHLTFLFLLLYNVIYCQCSNADPMTQLLHDPLDNGGTLFL